MAFDDFRSFVDCLRAAGEVVEINRPIALDDVGKVMKRAQAQSGPSVVFNDNGTNFPLICGVYGDRRKALIAFETSSSELFQKVLHGLDNPIPPRVMDGRPPCQDIVLQGADIDLSALPVPQYSPVDGGA